MREGSLGVESAVMGRSRLSSFLPCQWGEGATDKRIEPTDLGGVGLAWNKRETAAQQYSSSFQEAVSRSIQKAMK